jgi:hypothetical protein
MMPDNPLTLDEAREAVADHEKVAMKIGVPSANWGGTCHATSLALLRSGLVGRGRIARGWSAMIHSQHSWIVLGDDCYDKDAVVVDPTFWPTVKPEHEPLILVDYAANLDRAPHGAGLIYHAPVPKAGDGPVIELTPVKPLSREAADFLRMLGPLDRRGWAMLVHSPVEGWPAAEIITACVDTRELAALVPIDIVGMLTDRNPKGLYR